MCGRYAYTLPRDAMRSFLNTLNDIDCPPRYNIAPTQPIVIALEDGAGRMARLVRWGLVPHWVKDPREFPLLVNARSETIAEKPAFRDAVKHHRCVVPASGYYEWQRAGGNKTPYYVARSDGQPMAMAGLWSTWIGPDGEEIDTATIVTVIANEQLSEVHNRMPAILERDSIDAWLDVRNVRAGEAMAHLVASKEGVLKFHAVSSAVNSAKNDGSALIQVARAANNPDSAKAMEVKKKKDRQLDLF